MADKTRIPLAEAEALAAEVIALLTPFCERIEVAGSIRRRKPEVGDVEIVLVPKAETRLVGMFEDEEERVNLQLQQTCALKMAGVFDDRLDKNGRPCCGEGVQRLLYKGFALDVFGVVSGSEWGAIMLIRTGPEAFSRQVVTAQGHATPDGRRGFMPMGLCQRDGALYDRTRARVVPTPEEEDYFRAIGLAYVRPEDRS